LTLRVFDVGDLVALAAIEADPEVMRYQVSGPRPKERVAMSIAWFIQLQEKQGFSLWAVELTKTGEFLGYCGLVAQNMGGRAELELAFEFAKSHWHKGFATEAATEVRDWAFAHLNSNRIISIIDPSNIAAIRVAEKAGMRYVRNVEYAGKDCRLFEVGRPLGPG
jgi:RimJ/RimL family protein N-acetyltransferase